VSPANTLKYLLTQELQVEFEFFSPEEKDFLGLKSLLVPYLNGQEFNSSALIDAIIAEVCFTACASQLHSSKAESTAFKRQWSDISSLPCTCCLSRNMHVVSQENGMESHLVLHKKKHARAFKCTLRSFQKLASAACMTCMRRWRHAQSQYGLKPRPLLLNHPVKQMQGDVGSVVKTDSDDDPIAIMSVLSTHKYKEANFMQQIRQFLLDMCPKQADGTKLADLCREVRRQRALA